MDNGKKSKCYGTVYIQVNNLNYPVCASDWTKENGEIVCKELNCGKVSFQCQLSVALLHKCFIYHEPTELFLTQIREKSSVSILH